MEENKFGRLDLSHLTDAQKEAAKKLVNLKYKKDKGYSILRSDERKILCDTESNSKHSPHEALIFFTNMIPFLPKDTLYDETRIDLIPIAHTLGCSYKWRRKQYNTPGKNNEIEERIREHIFSNFGISRTSYRFIPELGLVFPVEGRNRVDFMREEGIREFPVRISDIHYPKASRISIHFLKSKAWAILDNRYACEIRLYYYVKPLLMAYGIKEFKNWPKALPKPKKISTSEKDAINEDIFYNPVVDLNIIKTKKHNLHKRIFKIFISLICVAILLYFENKKIIDTLVY